MTTTDEIMLAIALHDRWQRALTDHRALDTDRTFEAEQEAYDQLIDHIEVSGLNYSRLDPRRD